MILILAIQNKVFIIVGCYSITLMEPAVAPFGDSAARAQLIEVERYVEIVAIVTSLQFLKNSYKEMK